MKLQFAAISDVGRVRKDNQDSGYAGPWLLTVCDGVGGAARGDLASSTAVQQIRNLDVEPSAESTEEQLLELVDGALTSAHDKIAELISHEPALNSTSTTATVGLFDGERLAVGHVGDSRAYLFRAEGLNQLTHDHTFVQTLIDDGRITEAEARYHPHRNLILRAIDGQRDTDADLFVVPLQPGDRLMLCSDGVCGVLDEPRIADVLSGGSADYAAVELVRASLEAGSSDNVTCIVADVVPDEAALDDAEPQLVGAAAELRRRSRLFRGHRNGDTGELEAVLLDDEEDLPAGAIAADPIDPEHSEALRYAPRAPRRFTWLRRLLVAAILAGVLWAGCAAAWAWSQRQFYVGVHDGTVTIFRGINTSFAGFDLSSPYETTDLEIGTLAHYDAQQVTEGINQNDLSAAHRYIDQLSTRVVGTE